MIEELLQKSEDLWRRREQVNKFHSKYFLYPQQEAARILQEMQRLLQTIPEIESPATEEELIQAELKRRLVSDAFSFERYFSGKHYDYDTIISLYDIPREDLDGLSEWLLQTRPLVIEAIDRLFKSADVQDFHLILQLDIPSVRRQAEEFSAVHIRNYHKKIGRLLHELSRVGEYLRDINAEATISPRSYFNPLANNTLAIGIPVICYSSGDGTLHLRERELIRLYGHEGMGHALNHVVTNTNGLPFFLTRQSASTQGTAESVAQFYQSVLFEDINNSPETQRDLGIENKFTEIYRDAKDTGLINLYQSRLFQYALTVLGDKSLGDPHDPKIVRRKIELVAEVAIDPTYAVNFVENNVQNFDSQGNLDPDVASELMYAAQPVSRALNEFAKKGMEYGGNARSKIDETLLRGCWTPTGFVQNARLRAGNGAAK